MECPQCGYKFLGKIGRRKYFCSNCYSEIFISNNKYKVMCLNEKGIPTVVKTSTRRIKVHKKTAVSAVFLCPAACPVFIL